MEQSEQYVWAWLFNTPLILLDIWLEMRCQSCFYLFFKAKLTHVEKNKYMYQSPKGGTHIQNLPKS